MLAMLLDEFGDQAGPAGLVASAHPGAVITMEVLVEQHVIAPVGVVLKALAPAEHRSPAVTVAQKDPPSYDSDVAVSDAPSGRTI